MGALPRKESMFRLRDKLEKDVFEFSRLFKVYWSEHSGSKIIPSFILITSEGVCNAIILLKSNDLIETTARALRTGAGIKSFAIGVDGDIRTNCAGESLSVLKVQPESLELRIFPYSFVDPGQLEWGQEHEVLDCSPWAKYQVILHTNLQMDEIEDIRKSLGFTQQRNYFHSLRFVFSYLEKNPEIYVIDLISPMHPEWVDASEKLVMICDDLLRKKWINNDLHGRLISTQSFLGKTSFIHQVESLIAENSEQCNMNEFVNPAVFAELLHRKIFDYRHDLCKGESIVW